ncbi:PEP-CTERM sorting domain-containing protein [Akkermansiaceae bacterium]|nr:PEP-CTERM sorting domain-containing protein [Akkermansiaceae bacterium]
MKKSLNIILCASVLSSLPASAVVLAAGWDTFGSGASTGPSITNLSTTATLSSTSTWGQWNGGGTNSSGASTDGTFGSLSSTVASASTFGAGEGSNSGSNLSLNRSNKPGSLIFSLTNNSGSDQSLEGFYFDAVGRFAQSAKDWSLTFSGAISGTAASGTLTESDMMAATAAQRNWFVDLSGLTDSTWESGGTAIFTLAFSGGATSTGTGGGQETLVDNIGITVVPEPSAALLGALGVLCLLRRRR